MKTRHLLLTLAMVPALIAGKCSDPEPEAPVDPCDLCEVDEQCVADACLPISAQYEVYRRGSTGGIPQPETTVIDDAASFADYWNRLNANRFPAPEVPGDVEFRNDRLLAVHIGSRNSGGYGVRVDHIERGPNGLTVFTTETQPGANCIVTLAITSPYVVVQTPQTGEGVQFAPTAIEIQDCN